MPTADTQTHVAPEPPKEAPKQAPKKQGSAISRLPSIIVGLVVVAVAGLSIWYLLRGEPLLVQGEVDATRLDIAARVDGRVAEIPVERGRNVAAGAVLVKIDNPETLAKNEQALAAKIVAEAQLANVKVGTRVLTKTTVSWYRDREDDDFNGDLQSGAQRSNRPEADATPPSNAVT